ncbi:MAG: trypsin-like peptidase domain-containing protein [Chloroflexi bacterium]|nr:trypsin-like peptidase domain-containing protein [Chloroflexota bacterium]
MQINPWRNWPIGVVLAGLLVLIGTACQATVSAQPSATVVPSATSSPAAPAPPTPASSPVAAPEGGFSLSIRQVAQRVRPAVVQITNEQVQFDRFNQPFTVPAGVGSGVIYDTQGHILTNNHVVAGAQQLVVSLPDGRAFPGTLIGQDPRTDLAVLQVRGDNLPVAELGDSGKLEVGDWVVAIGNALALPGGPTVTAGVVSALGRTVQEPGGSSGEQGPFLFDVIQTDAPINPGNSGGPLVNLQGQVVGINTLVAGQAEPGVQAQGIGFAIATATARPIADQLVAGGQVVHPFLGIQYAPLSPSIAAQLGIQARQGVVVAQVVRGSPAASAGLQPRDVITAIDGAPLESDSALAEALNAHKPGDTVTLTVLRGRQTLRLSVTLGELPS